MGAQFQSTSSSKQDNCLQVNLEHQKTVKNIQLLLTSTAPISIHIGRSKESKRNENNLQHSIQTWHNLRANWHQFPVSEFLQQTIASNTLDSIITRKLFSATLLLSKVVSSLRIFPWYMSN